MRVALTGVTGALGGVAARAVLAALPPGDVVLTARRPATISGWGAEVRPGDYDRPATLRRAFAGCDRILFVSAPGTDNAGRLRQHAAVVRAAVAVDVGHVVYTSFQSPTAVNPAHVAVVHRRTEEMLHRAGVGWTFLRNAVYADFEIARAAHAVRTGELLSNTGSGAAAPVTVRDCGLAAAAALVVDTPGNQVYDVTGPRPHTDAQIAELISAVTGRPLVLRTVDDEEFVTRVRATGLSAESAAVLASFGRAVREGHLSACGDGVRRLTGRDPTALAHLLRAHRDELTRSGLSAGPSWPPADLPRAEPPAVPLTPPSR